MKNILTFRMHLDIKMNREVNSDKDYISPGGYTMAVPNKVVNFDFSESSISIDKKDRSIIHIEQRNPDYNEFPDLLSLTEENLESIMDIPEVFIYTGEPGETDLKPVKVLGITFVLPYNNFKNIKIPDSVINKAVVVSNI